MRTATILAAAVAFLAIGCDGGAAGSLAGLDLPGTADGVATDPGGPAAADVPLADGQVCRPGETRCMGSVFLSCNVTGDDWATVPCPGGTTCSTAGCVGGDTGTVGEDVPVLTDVPVAQDVPPAGDVVVAEDLPANPDVPVTPDVPMLNDLPVTKDVPIAKDSGPTPDVPATGCGNGPACNGNQECCQTPMGLRCVPAGQCPSSSGCRNDQDCPQGQVCCPPAFGGGMGSCQNSCGGGGPGVPTCQSDADCSGGQTCVSLGGFAQLCLSQCTGDGDCNGQACQEVGAFGYVLADVCGCAQDGDCPNPLICCDIPYVNVKTCLTQCIGG